MALVRGSAEQPDAGAQDFAEDAEENLERFSLCIFAFSANPLILASVFWR